MKKKIKILAYKPRNTREIRFFESDTILSFDDSERMPHFDIEKEIEVPDEPKKAREFTIILSPDGPALVFNNFHEPSKGQEHNVIHVREVLPEENKRKVEAMARVWDAEFSHRSSGNLIFEALVKAAGLEEV